MLGLLYIFLCMLTGYVFCYFCLPCLNGITEYTFKGKKLGISSLFVLFPAWFSAGTLIVTWLTYILACVFSESSMPLLYANEMSMITATVLIFLGLYFMYRNHGLYLKGSIAALKRYELIIFGVLLVFVLFLMRLTFRVDHDHVYVGLTVFSDFTPHLSMIRSFSLGQNFPTQYTVCAGEDVKYHFMFQFLVGNLEFLGMRLDHAFNIPSALSMFSMLCVLYAFGAKISGRRGAGILSVAFLLFRSSASLFLYLADLPAGGSLWRKLISNIEFIGSTQSEDWGLWNLNVYCNQRHFAFSITVMLIVLMCFIPHVYSMGDRLEDISGDKWYEKVLSALSLWFLGSESWLPSDIMSSIFLGLVLGAIGFWNGAVLICTVLVLFFMAAGSTNRLDYLITAAVAGALSFVQTQVFIEGSLFDYSYYYGFLSDNRTFFGAISYLLRLLGILPVLLLIVFAVSKGTRRYLMFCFSTPLIMAFTVSLTPDIAVNHKYIMMSVILLNMFAASFIVMLCRQGATSLRVIAVCLTVMLTATGIYDTYVLVRRNNPRYSMVYDLNDGTTEWIRENCSGKDIFLTSNYYLTNGGSGSAVLLSGARLYLAWQYFGWSAGYDTSYRDKAVSSIYGCTDAEELKKLVSGYGIDYIVVDSFNRSSDYYKLNEPLISETFTTAYQSGAGESMITIYKVQGE